jgi:hypothetical protein
MAAFRTSLRACFFTLLLGLGAALPAGAHTLITVTLEMVADGDELTINLSVSPDDIIACLAPRSPSTRGQLRALGAQLGPYLLSRLAVSADGATLGGAYAGYLADLLQPAGAITAAEALPPKLSFVLTWKLPASAAHLQVGVSLFSEERLPGFCQLILESGAASKRQVAYIELGKSWTFALHGHGEAQAPMPPALAQALIPAPVASGTAASAPPTCAHLAWSGLGTLISEVPLLLIVVLVALHPVRLRAALLQVALFVLAQGVGLLWAAQRDEVPSTALAGIIAAASAAALALVNLGARADAGAGLRLLLLAALGLVAGWALSPAARALLQPQTAGSGQLLSVALGITIGELGLAGVTVAATAWSWGGERHRRQLIIPSSLLAVLGAGLCALRLALAHPASAG